MDYVTILLNEDRTQEEWRELAADMLILTYVPEADLLTRDEALELALERDLAASQCPGRIRNGKRHCLPDATAN